MSKETIYNASDRRFEIYKIAFTMLDRESTLFWQRAYIFLLIHGAFITVIGIKAVHPVLFISFGILGITFSVFWIAVLKKGQEYVYRWIRVINRLEKELGRKDKGEYLFEMHAAEGRIDNEKSKFPKCLRKRTTTLVQYVIVSICIFWVFILAYGIYAGCSQKIDTGGVEGSIKSIQGRAEQILSDKEQEAHTATEEGKQSAERKRSASRTELGDTQRDLGRVADKKRGP